MHDVDDMARHFSPFLIIIELPVKLIGRKFGTAKIKYFITQYIMNLQNSPLQDVEVAFGFDGCKIHRQMHGVVYQWNIRDNRYMEPTFSEVCTSKYKLLVATYNMEDLQLSSPAFRVSEGI